MLATTFAVLLLALLATLAVRGAWAVWSARTKENGHGASIPTATAPTTTADRLAAILEGDEDPEATVEDKLEALALGIKNLRHRQSMTDGRLNKLDPPAEKGGKGNGAPVIDVRPATRADVYKRWREHNARK